MSDVKQVSRAWEAVVEALAEIDKGAKRDSAIAAVQQWAPVLPEAFVELDAPGHLDRSEDYPGQYIDGPDEPPDDEDEPADHYHTVGDGLDD